MNDPRAALAGALGAAGVMANIIFPSPLDHKLPGDLADWRQIQAEQRLDAQRAIDTMARHHPPTEQRPR